MDEFDRATEREEQMREAALNEQAHRAGLTGKTVADSARVCDCGEPIPEQRREAIPGVQTCVACQEAIEYRRKVER